MAFHNYFTICSVTEILQKELVLVERLIFKFVWSKDWNKLHVCERIKRSVLKAEYEERGLKAPDMG
jgi:hypothetical protein